LTGKRREDTCPGDRVINGRYQLATLDFTKNYLTVPACEYLCCNNLYLIVTETGARRWLFRFQPTASRTTWVLARRAMSHSGRR
jgi:hypothetical protein